MRIFAGSIKNFDHRFVHRQTDGVVFVRSIENNVPMSVGFNLDDEICVLSGRRHRSGSMSDQEKQSYLHAKVELVSDWIKRLSQSNRFQSTSVQWSEKDKY